MKYLAALFLIAVSCTAVHAQTSAQKPRVETNPRSREQIESQMQALRNRLAVAEKDFLEPSATDLAAFAKSLDERNTGLIRLLPREKYEKALTIRGGGAYYSFMRRTHEYGNGSDIELQQNRFMVGFAGADFGFIAMLGDVALDEVTTETIGVRHLAAFETPRTEPEAREQQKRGGYPGFEVDGFTYLSSVPVVVNKTYALRSINYGTSDVLVAFRVVREDADGSRVLLWRLLKAYPKPELERASN